MADGEVQVTAGRPIQPKVVKPLHASDPVQGVLLTGGSFADIRPYNPRIARPDREWDPDTPELQICLPSDWPSLLAVVNSLETAGGLQQTLVVTPAQFRCTSGPGVDVVGRERLWTDISLRLLRCAPGTNSEPPTVSGIDLRVSGGTTFLEVEASDASGIKQIAALLYSGGTVTSTPLDISEPYPVSGRFTVPVAGVGPDDALAVEVVGGDCQVSTLTAKGAGGYSVISVDAGPDQAYGAGVPTTLSATVFDFDQLIADSGTVFFTWEFGDGQSASGQLAVNGTPSPLVTVDANGDATFRVSNQYSGDRVYTATLRVTDSNGGVGKDTVTLRRCGDAAGDQPNPDGDLIACSASNGAATMTLAISVTGAITSEFQYRVRLITASSSYLLRYDGGKITGLSSLSAVAAGGTLRFTFNLSEIGVGRGDYIQWWSETQAGVPKTPEEGKPDIMPDSGLFGYVLR